MTQNSTKNPALIIVLGILGLAIIIGGVIAFVQKQEHENYKLRIEQNEKRKEEKGKCEKHRRKVAAVAEQVWRTRQIVPTVYECELAVDEFTDCNIYLNKDKERDRVYIECDNYDHKNYNGIYFSTEGR